VKPLNKNCPSIIRKLLPLILLVSGSFWILGTSRITANNLQTTVRVKVKGQTTTTNPNNGGGGGGGGGNNGQHKGNAKVTFAGLAYPYNKVYILKNGILVVQTIAGADAKFSVKLDDINDGDYTFSVWSEDSHKIKSLLHSFSVYITSGATTDISGILLPPTIEVDKIEVKQGDMVTIFGQTVPNAVVTITVNSRKEITDKVVADKTGLYRYLLASSLLEKGDHEVKTMVYVPGEELLSTYSNSLTFTVGEMNQTKPSPSFGSGNCPTKGDINNDCRVNLVDFSILSYWWGRVASASQIATIEKNLYADGKIDLRDFSIMAYYWTG